MNAPYFDIAKNCVALALGHPVGQPLQLASRPLHHQATSGQRWAMWWIRRISTVSLLIRYRMT